MSATNSTVSSGLSTTASAVPQSQSHTHPQAGTASASVQLSSDSNSSKRSGKRKVKQEPPIFSTFSNTFTDKNNDFVCPVCFEMIKEAYMTKCGHSFCYQCIVSSLEESNRCPKCNCIIERKDQIFPNFLLNDVILKYKQGKILPKRRKKEGAANYVAELKEMISAEGLELSDVKFLLGALQRRRDLLESDGKAAQLEILKDFLNQVKQHKQEQMDGLMKEVKWLDEDLDRVRKKITNHNTEYQNLSLPHVVPTTPTGPPPLSLSSSSFQVDESSYDCQEGFNASRCGNQPAMSSATLAARRKRVHMHFEDLESCYFNLRHGKMSCDKGDDVLGTFADNLLKFTRYSEFRPLATLSYASDIYNGSSIVSSIEFDRDCDFFAIAGVTKKIKVFEYNQVVRDVVDIHYPVHEMTCNSKISSIAWNHYHKGMLASSDYEGSVTLWDAFTGTHTRLFQEHEKRCWSVDFNTVDPKLIASGSDDAKVKLWATNMDHSVSTLEAKANVCCVKFNPESRYHLAFGSADHCVHYYDLRNSRKPLAVFKGHRKAVSYAKFVTPNEVVSASTDSQLKLWDISKQQCLKTFKGHMNEKNFVGLATNGDYIACGSENNSLCVYYKGVSKQLLSFKFDTIRSVLERDKKEDDVNEFVSAVCWKPDSNIVVAANSQGSIKVLELV
ncbi:E3 ubiquitin-protein ligase COP1-like [Rhopilema esculentum]|uniref:E3 ubiquitin-protein ligase COP1-like n=1 Tax=Rhopilema esculentum TaxID=499914 RepID=UPI0031D0941A|eukprot:gene10181-18853_t